MLYGPILFQPCPDDLPVSSYAWSPAEFRAVDARRPRRKQQASGGSALWHFRSLDVAPGFLYLLPIDRVVLSAR